MAKQAENIVEFDLGKYFGDLNKYVADFRAPAFDLETITASQRKNLEAVVAANRLAVEATQAVLRRQAEIMRQGFEEFGSVARQFTAPGNVPEKAAKHAELTKDAFERSIANFRELGEMVAKSNLEAADLVNKRFAASMDELRDLLLKIK